MFTWRTGNITPRTNSLTLVVAIYFWIYCYWVRAIKEKNKWDYTKLKFAQQRKPSTEQKDNLLRVSYLQMIHPIGVKIQNI